MADQEPDVLVQLDLLLANAKRLRRESTAIIQGIAQLLEQTENEQSKEDTSK